MSTRTAVEEYFAALHDGGAWSDRLAATMTFTNHASPGRTVTGRDAYLAATAGFFSMVSEVELRDLVVDGDRACAMTTYTLRPPVGEPFRSDVAEVLTVRDGAIDALEIYFDSAPYPG
jgi:ketosteroid isomerase-like protein